MKLGHELRDLRKTSTYTDLEAFAEAAGLSREGLRKIEMGTRLASKDSLEGILRAANTPDDAAIRLRKLRDIFQAKRDGLTAPLYVSEERMSSLVQELMETVLIFLGECELELPAAEKHMLHTRLLNTTKKEVGVP